MSCYDFQWFSFVFSHSFYLTSLLHLLHWCVKVFFMLNHKTHRRNEQCFDHWFKPLGATSRWCSRHNWPVHTSRTGQAKTWWKHLWKCHKFINIGKYRCQKFRMYTSIHQYIHTSIIENFIITVVFMSWLMSSSFSPCESLDLWTNKPTRNPPFFSIQEKPPLLFGHRQKYRCFAPLRGPNGSNSLENWRPKNTSKNVEKNPSSRG